MLTRLTAEVFPYHRTIAPLAVPALGWAYWVSGKQSAFFTAALAANMLAAAALVVIDWHTRRLPDAITLPTWVLAALLLTAAGLVAQDYAALLRAALGSLSLATGFWLLYRANPLGLGLGDVKLAAPLGLLAGYLGWWQVWWVAISGFLLGGGYAIALLVTRRAKRKTMIAFGPWMVAGFTLSLTLLR